MGFYFQAALVILSLACVSMSNASAHNKRGACIVMCNRESNEHCPQGYDCKSNGCGYKCYKNPNTFTLSSGCVDPTCGDLELSCFRGLKKDSNGCEICQCAIDN